MVMKAGVTVVRLMTVEKASVVVHCSDGWDRTTQIVCLAQLMIGMFCDAMFMEVNEFV